jgi:glycosyltransferase involved in cell wall biosynthesis
MPELSVLMPVYNERETVERAVGDVLEVDLPGDSLELIVVDDGSTDGTREILSRLEARDHVTLVLHDRNLGKGAAIRSALARAGGTYVAVMDADLEYDPADLARLLEPLRNGEAEVVYGPRGFASHSAYSFWYVVGNKLVTLVANMLYDSWLTDIMTCHKVMPTETLRSLDLRARGFDIEPEITARLLRGGVRIFEVPISYRARGRDEGKKLTAMDGLRVVVRLVRCRFEPHPGSGRAHGTDG